MVEFITVKITASMDIIEALSNAAGGVDFNRVIKPQKQAVAESNQQIDALVAWGTRKNATRSKRLGAGVVAFKVEWSFPLKVFALLSSRFPENEIKIEYAGVDLGFSVASFTLKNRTITEERFFDSESLPSRRAFAFPLVHPNKSPLDFGMNENFEYID